MEKKRVITGTRAVVYTAFFVAIMVVLAQVSIVLPFSPVPFTLGVLAVLLTGCFLGWKLGLAAVAVYIIMGLLGLPVFASFGSTAALVGPTGGYIIGYLPMVAAAGLSTKLASRRKLLFFPALALAIALCYCLGTVWYSMYADVSFGAAFALCVVPFVLFDSIKAALAGIISIRARRSLAL